MPCGEFLNIEQSENSNRAPQTDLDWYQDMLGYQALRTVLDSIKNLVAS